MTPDERVRELLRREMDPAEYREVRELWKKHSIAEDARDLPGLISTLTEDCVYEVLPGGHQWRGHEGATRFYTQLLTAFPDIHFALTNIAIGPQGVFEEAHVTGTHRGDWLDYSATGQNVEFTVIIFFPWDRQRKLFLGERVHFHTNDGRPFGQVMLSSSEP
jgi:predicted ester cyclase